MDDFRLQLSVRIDGVHLFNVRAASAIEFFELLKDSVTNAELIQSAARALEGAQQPEPSRPVANTAPHAGVSLGPTSGEIGPVAIKSVSKAMLKKDGTPMKSPRYVVTLASGKILSTFDASLGQSAETLAGEQVYYSTETKGEYTNLASVRKAS